MGDSQHMPVPSGLHALLVECPGCKQPGFMDAWHSIDADRDQEATGRLLKGTLFEYRCPVCGAASTMAYECLFYDSLMDTYVLFAAGIGTSEAARRKDEQLLHLHTPGLDLSKVRLVATPYEFCEKARILADGYDDRVVELMKVGIARGMLQEGIIGSRDILIYERTMDDGGISFVVLGEYPGDVVGVPGGYDYMKRYLENDLPVPVGEHRFDRAWANSFLP